MVPRETDDCIVTPCCASTAVHQPLQVDPTGRIAPKQKTSSQL